jgi:uncharacterized protein YecT (DUF1311 family)
MNLPKSLFKTVIGMVIVISFNSNAIAAWANPTRNHLQAQGSSPNCDDPQTQTEMNICAAIYYENADKKLNQVYQQLSSQMRSQLTDTQLTWIEFRDTNCEFARSLFEGGTIASMIQNGCLGGMTEQRTLELQTYQSGGIPQPISSSYSQVDRKLNEVYQNFLSQLNSASQNKLRTAERAWISFRDTNCAFEATQAANGENLCKIRMTEQRTEELSQLMDLIT